MEVADLAEVTHDPLLAALRQRLRKRARRAAQGPHGRALRVLARERWRRRTRPATPAARSDGSLNCHGYGSSVTVTATFGMVAAGEASRRLLARPAQLEARKSPAIM